MLYRFTFLSSVKVRRQTEGNERTSREKDEDAMGGVCVCVWTDTGHIGADQLAVISLDVNNDP